MSRLEQPPFIPIHLPPPASLDSIGYGASAATAASAIRRATQGGCPASDRGAQHLMLEQQCKDCQGRRFVDLLFTFGSTHGVSYKGTPCAQFSSPPSISLSPRRAWAARWATPIAWRWPRRCSATSWPRR